MGLVLDTSILVAAERGRFDLGAFLDQEASDSPIFITTITASELWHGVYRAEGARRARREAFVRELIRGLMVLPFDLAAAQEHARLWADLEKQGRIIGPHDLIIAACCMTSGYRIATLNGGEFSRIPGLKLAETWAYLTKP